MLRKHILKAAPAVSAPRPDEKDIAAIATVLVSSEAPEHPVDHVFDTRRGPGGSRWVGDEPGEQTLIVAFDTPQTLRKISLEIEEQDANRTQELSLALSRDGGQTYQSLFR